MHNYAFIQVPKKFLKGEPEKEKDLHFRISPFLRLAFKCVTGVLLRMTIVY